MCSVGLERLAHLLVAYSLGASASSVLGLLGLWLPRQVPLVAGAGLHLLLTLSLFFWAPTPRVLQHIWILYVAAVLWGVGSALNKTGLSSEYSRGHWGGWAGVPVATSQWLVRRADIPGADMGSQGGHPGGLSWGPVDMGEVGGDPCGYSRDGSKSHGPVGTDVEGTPWGQVRGHMPCTSCGCLSVGMGPYRHWEVCVRSGGVGMVGDTSFSYQETQPTLV